MGCSDDIRAIPRRGLLTRRGLLNGYLLDTNVALAGTFDPRRLSRRIRKAVESGPCYISAISYWEVMVKSRKGNLDVGNPAEWWSGTIESLALRPLAFRAEHVAELRYMQGHHSDPFDRALMAIARAEELAFLTMDKKLAEYASEHLQIVL